MDPRLSGGMASAICIVMNMENTIAARLAEPGIMLPVETEAVLEIL